MYKYHILHYTFGLPPKATGGLPLYVRDLSDAQKDAGYKVSILLPKQKLHGKDKISRKGKIYYLENSLPVSSIFGMQDPLEFMQPYSKKVINDFLNDLVPDILHVHTLMGLPKEFLEVAKSKGIRIVYTTHDYYGLCLKCNFVNSKGHPCEENNPNQCAQCNLSNGINKHTAYLINSTMYKNLKQNKLVYKLKTKCRDNMVDKGAEIDISKITPSEKHIQNYNELLHYYKTMFALIDMFHYNSKLTRSIYKRFLPESHGEVVPITLASIQDHRNDRNIQNESIFTIGYIGRKEPYKGIGLLMRAIEKLNQCNIDYKCLLYGDDFTKYDLSCNGKVKNMGIYKQNEIKQVFGSIDLLVVPSIWKETYGFIVLEALSYGVPVLVSENVGSQDLIKNKKYIFKIDADDLFNHLKYFIQNRDVLNKEYDINTLFVFSMLEHVKEINKHIYEA